MAIRKSELYSSLWASCDELRGGMDASQYKDYVLVLLFMKYVSDKAASRPDYDLVVPPGGSFADMVALIGDPEIGDKINKITGRLASANESLNGAFNDANFNDPDKLGSGKEMVDRLSKLVAIFNSPALDFRGNNADGDDLLGDAYEYLMRNFATESGKSKGQFYTPAEVSRVIAQIIGLGSAHDQTQTIYDPTCGSGSLLLKAHDEALSQTGLDLAIYGQEKDNATSGLARMNMVLHDATTAVILQGDTLANPRFLEAGGLKTYDYVVANPPFSTKSWSHGFDPEHDLYRRFPYGQPPAKNGDYAFLLHVLSSLKSTGTGAIILPHGVLFRGNSEATIRRELVSHGFIKTIIGLPANLFYGTGIPACIIVLDKASAATRKGVFMVDARRGFIKDGNKNRLRAQDLRRIVDVVSGELDVPGYSRHVPREEIETSDFSLNLPRYIDSSEPEDIQDIDGHLRGGIPDRDLNALEDYWQVLPGLRTTLFEPVGRPGYSCLRVGAAELSSTISEHPDFKEFGSGISEIFERWQANAGPILSALTIGSKPKDLLAALSESILSEFVGAPLLNPYDIYQCLASYWAETLQDDAYLIAELGWVEAAKPRKIIPVKGQKTKAEPDFEVRKDKFHSDLLPARFLIAEYFSNQWVAIEQAHAQIDALEAQVAAIADEHGSDDGTLEDIFDEKGKPDRRALTARLAETKADPESKDEYDLLVALSRLLADLATAKASARQARARLDSSLAARYGELTEDEIRLLAVRQKWLGSLAAAVRGSVEDICHRASDRVGLLSQRYSSTLPELSRRADNAMHQAAEHLGRMAAPWQ
jgi:type I restriction enzyme M protein